MRYHFTTIRKDTIKKQKTNKQKKQKTNVCEGVGKLNLIKDPNPLLVEL